MDLLRNVLTVGGTIGCAFGIGIVMQNVIGGPDRSGTPDERLAALAPVLNDASPVTTRVLPDTDLTSALVPQPRRDENIPASKRTPPRLMTPSARADCQITATATAAPMASARLIVSAPCQRNQRVEVHHMGLKFTERTDINGQIEVTIPALAENAVFLVEFENRRGTVARTHVPDMSTVERVALQWPGPSNLQIHALEFDATYGEVGHIWADSEARGQGNVTRLGKDSVSASQLAEIYTFPSKGARVSGTIALTVEAEVTPDNCGRSLEAHTLEIRHDRNLRMTDLNVAMPDCGTVGEFLVLNNLIGELRIAAK